MTKKKKKATTAQPSPALFDYMEYPSDEELEHHSALNDAVDLQTVYSSIDTELATQQSKRDQIIAFYLTILGLTASFVFSKEISNELRFIIFALLFVVGRIWSVVALRYRIYKESYWIACRTVSMLYTVDRSRVKKPLVQHYYYKSMKKNFSKFVKNGRINRYKVMKSNLRSAEFLMYMTLILLTSLSLGVCSLLLVSILSLPHWCYVLCALLTIGSIVYGVTDYVGELCCFYRVCEDDLNSSFNSAYQKAWQLHMFYDRK